ncbi:Dynamin family protein [Caulifigura coniformis]|uniref:Dynamin family protein n=1 Tax=Caulifigura coniformis TaxID=2527983 RepID=A0A517SF38_9PLAN|nr:dynamin family protein [Caulifigura coniformis]QDT54700.1 Dynamin family protein [Caulifigura coniformis]
MSLNELSQFEALAQIDDLAKQTETWATRPIGWAPAARSQALVKRVLSRVETLRIRLEAPLVVATFGGTGTGKSSLVNALVGEECSESGRQRPTTRRPIVIAHPRTELEALGLPLDSMEVIRRDSELLRDIVLIDCPDPDTSEGDTSGSNLAILRGLLPYCDVLIYTSTQQKYRSARVLDELGQGANGCRLFFVQTHADIDSDVREDWRAQLRGSFEVPDIFFVDSRRALREQQAGQRPSGDFGRLIDALATQLAASERVGVRRANVIDLLQAAFIRCRGTLNEGWPAVHQLSTVLIEQKQVLARRMAEEMKKQLLTSRHLWERRLLSEVTDTWGFTPFSAMLRAYAGLGGLIASFSFYRARNSVQMALIGAVQGARWLQSKHQELAADSVVAKASTFSLGDDLLREAEIVIEGHVRASELEPGRTIKASVEDLRQQAAAVERQFLGDAGRRIDEVIRSLASQNSRWYVRAWYETLFAAYIVFALGRVAKSFFYDSFWLDRPLLGTEFYIPALLFFVIWSLLLVTLFTHRLRRGLGGEIQKLVNEMVDLRLSQGLFPQWESACRDAGDFREDLNRLLGRSSTLRDKFAVVAIGGAKGVKREAVMAEE